MKVYISSDPVVEIDSKSNDKLWLSYQKASRSFARKNYEESAEYLRKSLKELGHSVPETKFELISGIIWQLARFTLDRVYIGKLFTRIGKSILKLIPRTIHLTKLRYFCKNGRNLEL